MTAERPPELVTVFESGNPAILAVAKSLLEGAGIAFLVKGAEFQDVFTLPLTEPVEILVEPERAEEARELLRELQEAGPAEPLAD